MFFHAIILESRHAEQVAEVHERAFKNFFLTILGKNFLTKFYGAILKRKDIVCRGYWDNQNRLAGFFVANYNHKGFYRNLCKENVFPFFAAAVPVFLYKPRLVFRLARAFSSNNQTHGFESYPYLMSICVDPAIQNQGLGKSMMYDLIGILQKKGYKGLYLTTDSEENNSTNSFYIHTGFVKKSSFYQGKRKMNVYFKAFSHPEHNMKPND